MPVQQPQYQGEYVLPERLSEAQHRAHKVCTVLLQHLLPCQYGPVLSSIHCKQQKAHSSATHVNWKVFLLSSWGRRWLRNFSYSLMDTFSGP